MRVFGSHTESGCDCSTEYFSCHRIFLFTASLYGMCKVLLRFSSEIYLLYRVSQEECARLRESVPYVKVYRYNPKHLYPKLNGYGDNGQ